jgi:hypothetical protein
MNDNNILDPLEAVLEKLLLDASWVINMSHLMRLKHPSKYRHVLVSIRKMVNEKLSYLDQKAAA